MEKEALRNLLAEGDTEATIKSLLELSKDNSKLYKEVILQSARFRKLKQNKGIGIISPQEEEISLAKINDSLLEIIDRISLKNSSAEENADGGRSYFDSNLKLISKFIISVGLIITIFGVIFNLPIKNIWKENIVNSPFTVTIIVHGKKGKNDRILSSQGKIVLDFGSTREEESINEQGEATFKELPALYKGKKALISVNHPQPYLPTKDNVEYILTEEKAIYLEVELKGLHKVFGRVLDYRTDRPLDSVRVSFQNVYTYTDKFGWYELKIPSDKQSKSIKLDFFKDGYRFESIDSIAPHTNQGTDILLEKQQQL